MKKTMRVNSSPYMMRAPAKVCNERASQRTLAGVSGGGGGGWYVGRSTPSSGFTVVQKCGFEQHHRYGWPGR
jgi:hypothetical protein